MITRLSLIAYLLTSFYCSLAQSPTVLTAAEAREDLSKLRFALEYTHPRLYKYDKKTVVDQRFDSAFQSLENDISGLDFLGLVSRLNASVNCGHLYTIPLGALRDEVRLKKVLPFYIKLAGREMHIFHDCSDVPAIPDGSRLLSINGRSTKEIYDRLLPGIATDGLITTRANRLIERYFFNTYHGFDLYYHLHIDRSSVFEIEYEEYESKDVRRATLNGLSIDERKSRLQSNYQVDQEAWFKEPSPQFELNEESNFAVLTISRSFHDSKVDPNYDSLLQSAFSTIDEKGISNLIIDLRDNEGGSENQQMELISYLYDQPYQLYQSIYQSHLDFRPLKDVIMERDTAQLLFNNDDEYMRKLSNELWINNYEYGSNLRLQPPKPTVYKGQVYVLMNGLSFSSAGAMIADIKKTSDAVFIGEESGSVFEGPTGGISIVVKLPNSGIMVRISPNIHISSMYEQHPIGHGVLPDHEIDYSVDDLVAGRDLEMEKALELISANK